MCGQKSNKIASKREYNKAYMETTLSPNQVNTLLQEEEEGVRAVVSERQTETPPPETQPHSKKNVYPAVRHILIIALVLFALSIMIFLIHQNGKSIYDNGI
jgi:hypothetical protein